MLKIRRAALSDLEAITEIYNQAILRTTATFDTETKTAEGQRGWFEQHGGRHPILVAEEEGKVIGWASISAWSDRCAYADTAEVSLYIVESHRGRGIGRQLSEAAITAGREAGLHTLIARIASENAASIHIAASQGFETIGVMKEVGRKFDRLLDIVMMQKIFPGPSG
jgi:phosphinothricin acetyltransferase